jgi:hypothetical protein
VSPDEEATLAALLLDLEKQLMDPAIRKDRDRVAALLAEEFFEFGSSGRVWTRAEILDPSETVQPAPAVEDFHIRSIAPELIQVTYRTLRPTPDGKQQAALRCSLWLLRQDRWQMIFHQGTKVPLA